MPIGKQSALLVDEERCTVTHSWILLPFLHIFSKVLYIPVFVKSGKIQRVARWQLHLIIILINHHHHTRLLLIVQLLRLLASTKQHRAKIEHYEYLLIHARQDAEEFCDYCQRSANQGEHYCKKIYYVQGNGYGRYSTPECENAPSLKRELEIVIHTLQTGLRRLGLQNAQVTYSEAYNTSKEYLGNSQWREVKTFSHYVVHVLAKW